MPRLSRLLAVWVAAGVCLPLHATADESKAEGLFREGRSQNEQPSVGALLNLARCHTSAGMTASAWSAYLAAARLARAQRRPEQAAEAELRAAELEPRVMYLRLQFEAQVPDAIITLDGEPLSLADLNEPVPVDPGSHVVRVFAPGHADYVMSVRLMDPGGVRSLTIPALTPLEVSEGKRLEAAPAAPAGSTHVLPTEAWVAVGIGTAALASSAVAAWVAKSKWDDAHEQGLCDSAHACNDAGLHETAEARRLGNFATIGTAIGVASFVSAGLFYATARASRTGPVRAGVALSGSHAVLDLRGEF
jgi:hypothetical protein